MDPDGAENSKLQLLWESASLADLPNPLKIYEALNATWAHNKLELPARERKQQNETENNTLLL